MIHSKRTQLRRQIRKSELEGLFAFRRKELLQGKLPIFQQLHQAIDCQQGNCEIQFVGKIINCLNTYPECENSYIITGNFLVTNSHYYHYFLPILTQSPKYIQNQMWCLKVLASVLAKEYRTDNKNQSSILENMSSVVETVNQILQNILRNLKRLNSSSDKDKQIWAYFMEILKIYIDSQCFDYFPHLSIALFKQGLLLKNLSEAYNFQEIISSWLCLKVILRDFGKLRDIRELLFASRHIFQLVLKFITHQRQQCLQLLIRILQNYSLDFMGSLFSQQLIQQLIYLITQIPALKPKISLFMRLLIPECSLDAIVFLLRMGTHKILTTTMDWSITTGSDPCLEECLTALYFILSRIKDAQEQRLLNQTIEDIESRYFDKMLQGLVLQSRSERVNQFLNLLIDDFYSSEEIL